MSHDAKVRSQFRVRLPRDLVYRLRMKALEEQSRKGRRITWQQLLAEAAEAATKGQK